MNTHRIGKVLGFGFFALPLLVQPFALEPQGIKWGALYILTFLLLASALIHCKELRLLRSRQVVWGGGTLAGLYLLTLFGSPGAYENQILDWVCFASIALVSCQLFAAKSKDLSTLLAFNQLSTLVFMAYGGLQVLHIDPLSFLGQSEVLSSFMGTSKTAAEFIGLSILLQIYSLYLEWNHVKKVPLLNFDLGVLFISLGYFNSLRCPGALLSLTAAGLPLVFLSWKNRLKFVPALATASALLFVLLPSLQHHRSLASPSARDVSTAPISLSQNESNQVQWTRWGNTLSMIQAKPWTGFGPGNFEFAYLPYSKSYERDSQVNELQLVRSPQNGYLQIAVQNGVPFLLAVVFALVWMMRFSLKRIWTSSSERHKWLFLVALLLFVLVDSGFASSFENAYVFYILAVFTGYALKSGKTSSLALKGIPRVALLSVLLSFVTYFTLWFNASKTVEAFAFDDIKSVSLVCNHYPANWRTCARKAELEVQWELFSEAERTSRQLLARNPENFLALHTLSVSLAAQGKTRESCLVLQKYDSLFENKSSLHPFLSESCEKPKVK